MRVPQFLRRAWTLASRPSRHLSLGFLTLGGFLGGVIFWGGFNTALEATNTETFCISCHEMHDNVYQELQRTIHFANRSGVRATCPDCHVPHAWTDKIARKMQASKEVWGHIFGTIRHAAEIRGAPARARQARVGAAEGERFPRVPQLSFRAGHGLYAAEPTRGANPFGVPDQGRANLHRLSQGDRARAARHDRDRARLDCSGRAAGHGRVQLRLAVSSSRRSYQQRRSPTLVSCHAWGRLEAHTAGYRCGSAETAKAASGFSRQYPRGSEALSRPTSEPTTEAPIAGVLAALDVA